MRIARVRFRVERNYAGWRLDRYLSEKIRRLSPERVAWLIQNRLETPDGQPLDEGTLLVPGTSFALLREVEPEPETPLEFGIIHDDGDVFVADKPAGLPVHPTARYFEHTFTSLVKARFPGRKIDPAHRIDRETSGLLACGGAPEKTALLKREFALGRVRKTYLALATGAPGQACFTVDAPLALTEASKVRVRMHVHPDGRAARTEFEILERRRAPDGLLVSLVACRPTTGRQHQIRAHLHHVGLPILGDKIYGPDENIFDRFTRRAMTAEDVAVLRLPRHALHAFRLEIAHPGTRRTEVFEAPLAKDLEAFWKTCVDLQPAGTS